MSEEGYKPTEAEIEKERAYETKSLLDDHSEFIVDKDGMIRLEVSKGRVDLARMEMIVDLAKKIPNKYPEWGKFVDEHNEKDNNQLFEELYDISLYMFTLNHDMAHGRLENTENGDRFIDSLKDRYNAIIAILEKRNNWRTDEFILHLKEAVKEIREKR